MGSRRFGEEIPEVPEQEQREEDHELMEWMRKDEIGNDAVMTGPFGKRRIIYCDYTASARAISSIEDYIKDEVLPFYGNTHSSVTVTAEQTTLFMHEARQEIRALTGAGDNDDVIFTGSGSTSAVELLTHLMQTDIDFIVVHSIQEHHSNLLPWRKLATKCVQIDEDERGNVDVEQLEKELKAIRQADGDVRVVGAFTACSNITGVLVNVAKVNRTLKQYNAISVWDYASAAPYTPMNVNGAIPMDALFFSGHKWPGAVSSPGVLVVKKSIIRAAEPKRIGGGTVFFVNQQGEWYLKESEHREEGGTPDAVGAVRLAMAVKLKRSVGDERIERAEHNIVRRTLQALKKIDNLVLLGPSRIENRLAVFSFLIKEPLTGLYYHHNYVSALLNDLFGIQTRSGCMCAGPYAHKLLGIDENLSQRFLDALREPDQLDRAHLRRHAEYSQREFLRPGFTRLSIPYFGDAEEIGLIIDCVRFVAENAGKLIHEYQVNCETSEWHHKNQRVFHGRRWLGHVRFTNYGIVTKQKAENDPLKREMLISEAKKLVEERNVDLSKIPDGRQAIDADFANLRWFALPIEVAEKMAGREVIVPECVIKPRIYITDDSIDEEEEEEEGGVEPLENDAQDSKMIEFECEPMQSCPLYGRPRGIQGDIGGNDEEAKEVRQTEDWNRRVVVRKVDMSREDEARLAWHTPPLDMYKKVTDVIHQLKMIKNGDKVLVCLSGGKDSLSLLHILRFYQQRCMKARSTKFDLGAITIDPGSSEYNPRPLIDYCRSLNIDYFYEEQDIIGAAKNIPNLRSICAFCSRMKRGRLAAAAQLHGWNVLAMGQHLDDLAESFFIAAFQNGNLSTMKAQYETKDGALRVIRPLVFVREKALRNFAEEKKLPVVAENCPACFNQATERHRIKQLLAQQELVFPDLFNSLRSALRPLLLVDSAHTSEMRSQAIENIVKTMS